MKRLLMLGILVGGLTLAGSVSTAEAHGRFGGHRGHMHYGHGWGGYRGGWGGYGRGLYIGTPGFGFGYGVGYGMPAYGYGYGAYGGYGGYGCHRGYGW
jgi:hypothetical protein